MEGSRSDNAGGIETLRSHGRRYFTCRREEKGI